MEQKLNRTVLLVEDDKDIRDSMRELLESEGYEVECGANGQEALDVLQSLKNLPKVILLDLMMPVMDGFTFRERQMLDDRISGIPIVIVTADAQVNAKKARIGASGSLKKPVNIDDILSIVSRFCDEAEE